MDKWPDAVMHYPVYMGLSFSNKDRLKDISARWYQSGAYPVQSLNYTYNELASAEKDALIFTDVIGRCLEVICFNMERDCLMIRK